MDYYPQTLAGSLVKTQYVWPITEYISQLEWCQVLERMKKLWDPAGNGSWALLNTRACYGSVTNDSDPQHWNCVHYGLFPVSYSGSIRFGSIGLSQTHFIVYVPFNTGNHLLELLHVDCWVCPTHRWQSCVYLLVFCDMVCTCKVTISSTNMLCKTATEWFTKQGGVLETSEFCLLKCAHVVLSPCRWMPATEAWWMHSKTFQLWQTSWICLRVLWWDSQCNRITITFYKPEKFELGLSD